MSAALLVYFVLGLLVGGAGVRIAYHRGRRDSMAEALAIYDRTIGTRGCGCSCAHEQEMASELRRKAARIH